MVVWPLQHVLKCATEANPCESGVERGEIPAWLPVTYVVWDGVLTFCIGSFMFPLIADL